MLTIALPAYNAAPYIEKAIKSLQRQSYDDWRLIVVDDASNDNTADIVGAMASEDSRITLIKLEQNSGCAYIPRKTAIMAARTEWVMTLDADDWVESEYIARLVERQRDTKADIVWPVMYATPPGKRLVPQREYTRPDALYPGQQLLLATLPEWKISAAGGLIKKALYAKAFEEVEDNFDVNNIFSDEAVTRAMLLNADKVAFEETIYYYRMHQQSVTHKLPIKKWENYLTFGISQIAYLKKRCGEDSEQQRAAQIWLFHTLFDALKELPASRATKSEFREILKEIRLAVDLKEIAPYTSKKYRLLWRLPAVAVSWVMKLKK